MYKFSLIIPHHNTPDLLRRCIESIPKRDDLQLIIVDDNSSNEEVDFDLFPGLNEPNTQVIFTKEGKGGGFARNVGLRYAQGEWLLFSDADDTFNTNIFSKALDIYKDSDCDIVYFNSHVINADTGEMSNNKLEIDAHIKSNKNEDEVWFRYKATYPWAKMIKKTLVEKHGIKFDEVIAGNDAMFSLLVGHYAEKILLCDMAIYNWMFRSKGNVTSNLSLSAAMSKFDVAIRRNSFMEKVGVSQYRQNYFEKYVFLLHKAGLSYPKSFMKVLHNTPYKYILLDLISFVKFVFKHIKNK